MNRQVLTAVAIAVAVLGFVLFSAVFTVHQTQQALVLQFGDPRRVIKEPGLQFKTPFIQDVVYLDKRILSFDAPSEEIIASDQRRLVVDSFARFRIADPLLFYQRVGNEAIARARLATVINGSLRRVLASQDSTSIVSGERAALMGQIRDFVNAEAKPLGIEVVDVRIKRADFPDTVSQAIFRRMQTEREREAREIRAQGAELSERIRADAERQRTILLAEAQRNAEILRGEGDAERTRIFAEATGQDPEFYGFYRSLQAYAEALRQSDTSMVLSPRSEFFRFFGELPAGSAARPAR
jgi:membrane protease subunit HflC